MAKSVSTSIKKHLSGLLSDLFEEDAFFIIGVSGGPDSMALLYLLHVLEMDALAVHINYGKRGKESDQDQELAEQMAFAWGFECCSIKLDPKESRGENFQNWARKMRYQYFEDLKEAYQADAIAVAHHQDDQVETILQKVLRGSSPSAWQGMKTWDGKLFRPLLTFTKQSILDLCEEDAIPYRIDKSNKSSEFARNFLRNEFSEALDDLFPGWEKNILELPRLGKTFEESLIYIADQVSSSNTLLLKKFSVLSENIKPAVLKTILDQTGERGEYTKGQLKELSQIETIQTGKSLKIGSLVFTRDRDRVHFKPKKNSDVVSKSIHRATAEKGYKTNGLNIEIKSESVPLPSLRLDAAKLNWPLQIRTWNSGDEFNPLGMSGSQKVSDHLTNRKIPTVSREKTLVLCGSDGTIYAIIYPVLSANGEHGAISEMVKCKSTTQTFLTINFT
ncbi:MAG: tRNA lysidine(34) synthetase TilS [Gracilimonas sp.]